MKKLIYVFAIVMALCFTTAAQTNTFPANGNVGIGTTAATAKITFNNVSDGSNLPDGITWYGPIPLEYGIYRTAGPWEAPYQQLKLNWETGIILNPGIAHGKSYVDISGGGLRVSSGNVGIGELHPVYKLNVAQDIQMNADIDAAQFGISGSTDLAKRLVLGYDVTGAGFGFIKAGWYHHQWTNLSLQPNGGNVGIGTTTPTEKLSVNGNIRAKEIKVETANWPDYVFEEDYKIPDLQELNAYIKTNKHLPDMPSAKEVERDGIKLGEVNKLLLKKIEELTLHLIEKDQEILQ